MRLSDEYEVLIRSVRFEAKGVLSFELEGSEREKLPTFEPGAHINVLLPEGISRQYSLINTPDGHRYIIAVGLDRSSRGGSRWLHNQARAGMILMISAPANNFPLCKDAAKTVLFAGGIGITPIRAMAAYLNANAMDWSLHYAARSRATAAFADELQTLGGQRVHLHIDDEAQTLMNIAEAVASAPTEAHLYCCGPTPMITAFIEATKDRAPSHVHIEYFAAIAPLAEDQGLVVELAKSGKVISVKSDQTILEAVLAAGIMAPSSCRNGVCGTCETRVLAGEPDHRDLILNDAEKKSGETMMICCSRAKSARLTLDL